MSNAQHTPTPWVESDDFEGDIRDGEGELLATAYPMDGDVSAIANAAFIVRACNSHDQLVAALTEALATIDDYLAYEHNGDPWTEDARAMGEMDIDDYANDGRLERARAALTAAGEA